MQLVEMSGCQAVEMASCRHVEMLSCRDVQMIWTCLGCRDAELSRCHGKTLNRLPVGSKAFWK